MKKKILLIFSLLLLVISFLLFVASPVFAQEELPSPVSGDMTTIIANVIKLVLGLVGVLALVFFIYGGITWMTSAGNVEQVKKGKNTLVWATLGLAVCFLAYSLVTFVITKTIGFGSSGSTPPPPPQECQYHCVENRMICDATDGRVVPGECPDNRVCCEY